MKAVSNNDLIFIRDVLMETKETKEAALDLDDCLDMVIALIESKDDIDLNALLQYNQQQEQLIDEVIHEQTA